MTVKHSAYPDQRPNESRQGSSRRKLYYLFFAIVFLSAVWSIYWFTALTIMKDALTSERQKLARSGMSLSCAKESWDGYPFRFSFNCATPVFDHQTRVKAVSENISLSAAAYMPWKFFGVISGPSSFASGDIGNLQATHRPISVIVTIDMDLQPILEINIPHLEISGLLSCENISANTSTQAAGLHNISMSFQRLNYQPDGRPELRIERGDMSGLLSNDGELAVNSIELREGNVRYWGNGNITLDDNRRLLGKLATETNDLEGLLAILEPHLEMTDQQKAGFRTILGLLGTQAKSDIIARSGELFVGPFKVADLLPLY